MNRAEFPTLPASFDRHLERFKINASRRQLSGQQGSHINRRMGQSLEFRDFGRYTIGDDIRHVDWRVSARQAYGQVNRHEHWMIRRFHAEEQLSIVVSVDNRDTMLLPAALPKLQIALWIAEALARVALSSTEADKIAFHSLFGDRLWPIRNSSVLKKVSKEIAITPPGELLKSDRLMTHLPPAGVWVIITDLYFGHGADSREQLRAFASMVERARNGRRWVILINLDSWPWEREILRSSKRPLRILRRLDELRVLVDSPYLQKADQAIKDHLNKVEQKVGSSSYDLDRWRWPEDLTVTAERLFLNHFFDFNSPLSRLFMRETI